MKMDTKEFIIYFKKRGIKKKIGFTLIFLTIIMSIYIIINDQFLIPLRYHNTREGINSIIIPSDGIIISRTLVILFLLYLITKLSYYLINND